MSKTTNKLGFWSAILSAVFAVVWFVAFSMKDAFAPVPEWTNLQAYVEAFDITRIFYVYPSLLLALTYIVLMACVHRLASEDRKIWSLIALSVGIVYAAMASINYNVQAVAVRQSLAAAETAGLELWIPDNPHSIFGAMANSYVYLAISMVFAGFVFQGERMERWMRRLFFAQAITAIGQIGETMFDLSTTVFYATSMVWVIGAPVAFVLLAVLFRRDRTELGPNPTSKETLKPDSEQLGGSEQLPGAAHP
jgi:hypothetical protein